MQKVPISRIREVNLAPLRQEGGYVLYWMIASRRTRWSFALQRAVEMATELNRPLVVLEPLRCGYPYASDRLHAFILQGMAENARSLAARQVLYHPYVEPEAGEGKGLLLTLAERACLVVTDDYPAFFLPRMVAAAAAKLAVRLEAIDGNGLLPLHAADHDYPTAYAFRRFLQKVLPKYLLEFPVEDPLQGGTLPDPPKLPAEVLRRWPGAGKELLAASRRVLARMPIDHSVHTAPARGGSREGVKALRRFLEKRLARYSEERNEPEAEVTSGLSPYLHFGHVSVHQVFAELAEAEGWSPDLLGPDTRGKRTGWWGMGVAAEAFLDQVVTWRELGFNMCTFRDDYAAYASLPEWARRTLEEHRGDPRPVAYTRQELEAGKTRDPLWNAAQMQLVREGRLHNYLRMLWGKKILEWTPSPQDALETMIAFNDRYALDGRDPNSYSGILWCLGRYDRAWGPERPIFGKIRYMSSENTARKVRVKGYLEKYRP
ncbi:deoxyribodipyrimidine photolyase [uncultured Desulfuromonas sp.]|uniref:deoxyribodipyrimidine photolyase n=1 Tax=uncultured Desulfuromonas sp. TaxID=181013 RepID=UPI002615394B|nr:deoxyribodipyrimidine photolyase [uncultured Desulfuromonas sp.]